MNKSQLTNIISSKHIFVNISEVKKQGLD